MYMWYAGATVCYAYLADVPAEEDPHAEGSWFRDSQWFTRGWTLQELIAPRDLVFLSQDWVVIGSKHALVPLVESVTGIDGMALLHLESLDIFSISQRLSWASKRETTRVEDKAYSLLGLFDIHIPIVYGEGKRAFQHLQEQIMQRIQDQSLFAWGGVKFLPPSQNLEGPGRSAIPMECTPISGRWLTTGADDSTSLFATDVSIFRTPNRSIQAVTASSAYLQEYRTTPHGICTQFQMIPLSKWFPSNSATHYSGCYLAILACGHQDYPGHLLGRVCFVSDSSNFAAGIELLYPGVINGIGAVRRAGERPGSTNSSESALLLLSPQSIELCRQHIEVKTVYISHPDHRDLGAGSLALTPTLPDEEIKLLLLKTTCNGRMKREFAATLTGPGQGHPATHWLTLTKGERTITLEFQHEVWNGGINFTIECQDDLRTGPNKDIHKTHTSTMRWNWAANHLRNFLRVEVDTGAERLTIKIGLKSAGMGFYALYIDILPEVLPESSGELGFQEDQLPASASTINGNEDSLLDGQSQRGRGGERLKDRSENYEGVAM